jgi:hypothetical protein
MKIGDRVILISGRYDSSHVNPVYEDTGMEGSIVKEWPTSNRFRVLWDNDIHNNYSVLDLDVVDESIIDVDELFKEIEL